MELEFSRSTVSCLDTVLREVQNTEQTLEMKLSDTMPDVGHVIGAWAQTIARSKEWRGGSLVFSGGVLVWVLYAPEDGSEARVIDGWMPFQLRWDLPPDTREGEIRIQTLLRNVDARSVSARKLMARAGVAVLAEAFSPMEAEVFAPDEQTQGAELLQTAYPMRLTKEAGEKTFSLEEAIPMPDSEPKPDQFLYFRMEPQIQEKKVLASKAVFRGSGNLHVLYRGEDGKPCSRDIALPFSQFAELQGEYSGDAQLELAVQVTALELELGENGDLQLKAGLTAQYLITDRQLVAVVEDAYAPGRETQLHTRELELPAVLETRRDSVFAEQSIPTQADRIADVQFLPDFPIQRRTEAGVELELPGVFQVLYDSPEGELRASTARWSGQSTVSADENSRLTVLPGPSQPQAMAEGSQITLKAQVPMETAVSACQTIPMVTGLELGQPTPPDPARPSLILRRAGSTRLWDIAKQHGTTPAALRQANGLQEEPAPGQMLLIPIP